MRSTVYKNWDDYIKYVKKLHPGKVTESIEYFMRYTWKDAMNVAQQTLNAPAPKESTPQICDSCTQEMGALNGCKMFKKQCPLCYND